MVLGQLSRAQRGSVATEERELGRQLALRPDEPSATEPKVQEEPEKKSGMSRARDRLSAAARLLGASGRLSLGHGTCFGDFGKNLSIAMPVKPPESATKKARLESPEMKASAIDKIFRTLKPGESINNTYNFEEEIYSGGLEPSRVLSGKGQAAKAASWPVPQR
ncbi:unnamed protein product [Effrenium voratum]|nr:unnamed protein product [Effrenium voratum]